ncbi:hypothetical protein [Actinomadura bangladeshensis]|uniref:Uncharacterized protein n=1 Tax=Actinomadura bangladeshensis TaxID=453573 RepID=A0A4R4N8Y8_9ACTN|nr:hypothetical protein [Actinomadura bangladeshensis]TDC05315.1 hypothetical protein E1284_35615 [Actinomadura bangladeshensis]
MPVLLRLAAIVGFAVAGWLALSALNDSAFAAERPHAVGAADEGSATLRHFTSKPGWYTMTEDVRDMGSDPMRYVRSRQHDLFDDKDRAVGHVRKAADAAGVPRLRLPDLRPERPVLGGLATKATDTRPVRRPDAGARPEHQDTAGTSRRASKGAESTSAHPNTAAKAAAAPAASDCSRCRDDRHTPAHGPVQPGQEAPQGGGSTGGHPLTPVADLPNRRHPAAPAAADAGTFRRTALTDVAAPGGPSVVPD